MNSDLPRGRQLMAQEFHHLLCYNSESPPTESTNKSKSDIVKNTELSIIEC